MYNRLQGNCNNKRDLGQTQDVHVRTEEQAIKPHERVKTGQLTGASLDIVGIIGYKETTQRENSVIKSVYNVIIMTSHILNFGAFLLNLYAGEVNATNWGLVWGVMFCCWVSRGNS